MKLKHKQWRERAYDYILNNGPQTAETLVSAVRNSTGTRMKSTPNAKTAGNVLFMDKRFASNKRAGRGAIWYVIKRKDYEIDLAEQTLEKQAAYMDKHRDLIE